MDQDCACFMKKSMGIVQSFGVGFVIAGVALSAFAADAPTAINPPSSQPLKEIAPSELKVAPAKPEASEPKQKESARPGAKPAPAESRTPEDAAARAADPKDPSGALIIKVPAGTGAKP
jgi:outer membrane biosynthesis protein TonB